MDTEASCRIFKNNRRLLCKNVTNAGDVADKLKVKDVLTESMVAEIKVRQSASVSIRKIDRLYYEGYKLSEAVHSPRLLTVHTTNQYMHNLVYYLLLVLCNVQD